MSLLNDMLKDLSTQKLPITFQLPPPIDPSPRHKRSLSWGGLGVISISIFSLLLFFLWPSEPESVPFIPISFIPSIPASLGRSPDSIEALPVSEEVLGEEESLSQSTDNNSTITNEHFEIANNNSEITDDNPEVTEDNSEMTENNSEITDNNSEMTGNNSEFTDDNSEMTIDNSGPEGSTQFKIKSAQESQEILIKQYIDEGNLQPALTLVNEMLKLDPKHLPYIYLKARILAELERSQEAIMVLESHNPSLQNHTKFYALEAAIYQSLGRTEEAGSIYQSLLKLHPENGRYWLGLAIALENKQSFQQAIEAYRHATESDITTTAIRSYAAERLNILKG